MKKIRLTGRLTARLISTFMVILMTSGVALSQFSELPRLVVDPDNFPLSIGALNRAIEQNGGDYVYVLKNGATYFLERDLAYDHPIYLEAVEYPSSNPPILRAGTNLLGNSRPMLEARTDTEMRGLFIYGLDDLGGLVHSSQVRSAEGSRHVWRHCYWAGGQNYTIINRGTNATFRIEDSYAINMGRPTSIGNQRFFDTRGNDVDSLIVINTTLYNSFGHVTRLVDAQFNYFHFNHVTIYNTAERGLELGMAREAIVENSLIHNRDLFGAWEYEQVVGDAGPGYNGTRELLLSEGISGGLDGFIFISSYSNLNDPEVATDADRSIIIRNNNFGGLPNQVYLDLWEQFSTFNPNRQNARNLGGTSLWRTDPKWLEANPGIGPDDPLWATRDTLKVVRINKPVLDSTLTSWRNQNASWFVYENNLYENVTFVDPPDVVPGFLEAVWYGESPPSHYDRWDEIQQSPNSRFYHPGPGTPTAPSGNTASWFRDLGYNQDAPSFTQAEKNYPLGNLNYYPDLRQRWERGEVITSVEQFDQLANSFQLLGIYPNPFNPSTNIVFELGSVADVSIEIFNVLGQRVSFADLGPRAAGKHEWTFNAANLTSGVYLVRLQMGQQTLTRAITLLK